MPEREVYDIIILGAGPTGLFGAFYAGMREMRTKIIENLPEPGGQLAVLYPEKYIYDVAGFPRILAKELVKGLLEQANTWHPTLCYEQEAVGMQRLDDGTIEIRTNVETHYCKALIICGGIGSFHPNKLKNESITRYEGHGIYYFIKDKKPFHKKRLLVIGGGDSAVDWALNLKDYAAKVTLIHRREGFRAHASSVTELMSSTVDVRLWHELKEVHGNGNKITGATIFDNRSGEETELDVDVILLNLGFKADLGGIKDWGLELDKRYIVVNTKQETNIPGVYAAGDIARHPDAEPLNLIAVGFGHVAIAVNNAASYITGGKVFPGHSSEMRL